MTSQITTFTHIKRFFHLHWHCSLFVRHTSWGSSGRKEKKVCPPYIQTVHNIVAMLSTTATGYVSKAKIIINTLLGWLLLPPHLPNTPRPWMERSMFDAQNADMVEAYGYALTLMQCIKWITVRHQMDYCQERTHHKSHPSQGHQQHMTAWPTDSIKTPPPFPTPLVPHGQLPLLDYINNCFSNEDTNQFANAPYYDQQPSFDITGDLKE